VDDHDHDHFLSPYLTDYSTPLDQTIVLLFPNFRKNEEPLDLQELLCDMHVDVTIEVI
jgi:hypothetical protein